jgi:type I restriction enzyme, S subunit
MKSNYSPIGKYIRLVDERNKGLQVTNLVGLSISKQFIKSVANTIGTDMENYKIIQKNQFACSTMQVRRDKKMPLALYAETEPAIISQAYPVFEIIDTSELLPEYLMMWFTRSEFDREACFQAVGGVRGSLEWEDFCNMKLPVPSPEKQQEIVNEYNVIQNRIKLNENLCQKLEETAQAIYKRWFVEFEFPNENGLPYKSSGGEMVESELGEIPKDWKYGTLNEISKKYIVEVHLQLK